MKAERLILPVALVLGFAGVGCESSAGPENEVVRLGALYPFGAAISVPETVIAGVPFEAVVTTWGNGCLLGAARSDVDASSNRILITPFDRWVAPRQNVVCPDEEVTVQHVVHSSSETRANISSWREGTVGRTTLKRHHRGSGYGYRAGVGRRELLALGIPMPAGCAGSARR